MYNEVLNIIEKYKLIPNNSNVIIGLSGGADSVCLVHILCCIKEEKKLNLIAVHINHNLRGNESDNDEKFVKELCGNLGIDCKVFSCDVKQLATKFKISDEEAGRNFRYECFREMFLENKINVIAVAHNKNDQAETILMRLFRGSGMKGLCGINAYNNGIVRPLLFSEREEIEKYCDEHNLSYVSDSSNFKNIYTRNKIRLDLIPYIQNNFNKNIINSLSTCSENLKEDELFLEKLTKKTLKLIIINNSNENQRIIISVEKFDKLDIVLKKRIIREIFLIVNGNLTNFSSQNVNDVLNLSIKETGKKIFLSKDILVRKNYDQLIFYKNENLQKGFCYFLEFNKKIYIEEKNFYIVISDEKNNNYTKSFSYDNINGTICLRTRQQGDKIYLNSINGSKKIKNYFIDEKIDNLERNSVALLAINNEILWIMDEKNITSDKFKGKTKKMYVYITED